jgi:hypothetical protein
MKTFDFAICGNNTGALVAAIELGKKHNVAIINPAPNWGAHFAGFPVNGENFDIGMNFFEFTTFHKPSTDLMSYNPAVRNDSARFFKLVEDYIASKIEYVEVDAIDLVCNGIYAKDIVMANSLDVLQKLPKDVLQKIRSEVEDILKKGDKKLHASQKKLNEELFLNTNYYDVSVANHGQTFHDLFVEPFCKKIFNMSSKDCPSLLHRIAWAPLFYPETLLKGLNGEDDLAPTVFHYPKKGYFAAITDAFMAEIRANKNITIIAQKINNLKKNNHYEIEFDSETISVKQVVWCNDLFSLLQTAKANLFEYTPQKASVTVAFCFVDKSNILKEFSSLYVCDNLNPLYRITNQEYSAKKNDSDTIKLVFEYNLEVLNEFGLDTNEKISNSINSFLIKNDIIKTEIKPEKITIKALKNAVNMPTLYNFNNFEKLSNLTRNLLTEVELIGPASGFVSTSFNDQVVQALKIGKKYS